jgi:hypothetical protein
MTNNIIDYKIDRKVCPRCNTPCHLRAISSYDPRGEIYGAMFVCPKCGWDDWGNILNPADLIEIFSNKPKKVIKSNEST